MPPRLITILTHLSLNPHLLVNKKQDDLLCILPNQVTKKPIEYRLKHQAYQG